ncbi:hypothetical protein PR048_026153 [Dryococelus australis]|uniref:Uncharacterized protein n=1 Tax=Dryococelus australis TaxID=614101 RepID=A0ABQ9GKL9_9NEOP|nr:hypothetical protein PR048_026153 [Dryococelus australis]
MRGPASEGIGKLQEALASVIKDHSKQLILAVEFLSNYTFKIVSGGCMVSATEGVIKAATIPQSWIWCEKFMGLLRKDLCQIHRPVCTSVIATHDDIYQSDAVLDAKN